MTYPVKTIEPDRSSAGLFWSLALVLTVAWVYFSYSEPTFATTSRLHTPLLSSLSILTIALAVWRWSGRWWVLLLVFTSPFILWPLHTTILDTLPLLGLLIYTFFAPPAEYAPNYAGEAPLPEQWTVKRFCAEAASIALLLIQPQIAGAAAVIIWLRSFKKWWLLGTIGIICFGYFQLVWFGSVGQFPYASQTYPAIFWPWTILIGIVLFWISIGQRDVLIGAGSTVFLWPAITSGSLTTFAVILAVRLPKLFFIFSLGAWVFLIFSR